MKHFKLIPRETEQQGNSSGANRGFRRLEDAAEETTEFLRAFLKRDRTSYRSSRREQRRTTDNSHSRYFVRDGVVYEPVIGGPDRVVGYERNGVRYEPVIGGPDRPILDDYNIGGVRIR